MSSPKAPADPAVVPVLAVLAATKSGFLTSEFVLAVIGILMAALSSILVLLPDVLSKVNPILGIVAAAVIPAAVAWISSHYTKGRTDVKVATLAATSAATASPSTVIGSLNK